MTQVALLGADLPGLRPKLLCAQGDRVGRGQALFHDRANPEVVIVSPGSGIVDTITLGPRRSLSALVIRLDPDEHEPAPTGVATSTDKIRETLLAKGFWPAFLTRPYGRIPAPDAVPEAIFVNVTLDNPHAPDPRVVLRDQGDAFPAGLKAIAHLTSGTVHVCQTSGAEPIFTGCIRSIRTGRSGASAIRMWPRSAS